MARLLALSRLPKAASLILVALLLARPAAANELDDAEEIALDEEAADADESSSPRESADTPDHQPARESTSSEGTERRGQIGLRLGVVGGYRMMFRYDPSPFCTPQGSESDEACFYGAPWATEFALSYSVTNTLELFVWSRLGLGREPETDTDALRALGAGIRVLSSHDTPLKMFVQPLVALSFEGGGRDPAWRSRGGVQADYRSDLLFHISLGPQYDFNRHLGVYGGVGMTAGTLRALSATVEGSLGLQVRYP